MITDIAFHYAYYELSEAYQSERREHLLNHVNRIREACIGLGIENREITDLKLSHYILILDIIKNEHQLNLDSRIACAAAMSECLEFLIECGTIDHNPVKNWLLSESKFGGNERPC